MVDVELGLECVLKIVELEVAVYAAEYGALGEPYIDVFDELGDELALEALERELSFRFIHKTRQPYGDCSFTSNWRRCVSDIFLGILQSSILFHTQRDMGLLRI